MTTPTGPEIDPGPVPEETPLHSRAAKIAAIHALADHFEKHPEYPIPGNVLAMATIAPADEVDEQLRIDVVDRFHRDHAESHIYESSDRLTAMETLLAPMVHGIHITYHLTAQYDPPRKRYKA